MMSVVAYQQYRGLLNIYSGDGKWVADAEFVTLTKRWELSMAGPGVDWNTKGVPVLYDQRTAQDGHEVTVRKRRHVDQIIEQTFDEVWYATRAVRP